MKVLIITANDGLLKAVSDLIDNLGIEVIHAQSPAAAQEIINRERQDVVLVNSNFRKSELIRVLGNFHERNPTSILILLGPRDEEQRESISRKLFASHSISPDSEGNYSLERIRRIVLRKKVLEEVGFIGTSPAIEEILETIIQIAPANLSVLLTGESGTGKELAARSIHLLSERRTKPFLAVNCAALADSVLESELFGHERGAVTGAVSRREGMFEKTRGGSLFLDEIGEITPRTQVKLLRVLDEREFMRVGGSQPIKVDVRVIAATNRDLRTAVKQNEFRKDLYYRLKVVEIHVPSLRERREDISLLVEHFIREYSVQNKIAPLRLSKKAMAQLVEYPWYGNIRELKNYIESLVALAKSPVIHPQDLPPIQEPVDYSKTLPVPLDRSPDSAERELIYRVLLSLREEISEIRRILLESNIPASVHARVETPKSREVRLHEVENVPYEEPETLGDIERRSIEKALRNVGGKRKKAAKSLGISERTLYRKIKEYGL